MFYCIIRAGNGVFCLLGLTKVMFVSNISDATPPPPLLQHPLKKTEIATLYGTM